MMRKVKHSFLYATTIWRASQTGFAWPVTLERWKMWFAFLDFCCAGVFWAVKKELAQIGRTIAKPRMTGPSLPSSTLWTILSMGTLKRSAFSTLSHMCTNLLKELCWPAYPPLWGFKWQNTFFVSESSLNSLVWPTIFLKTKCPLNWKLTSMDKDKPLLKHVSELLTQNGGKKMTSQSLLYHNKWIHIKWQFKFTMRY